MPCGEPTPDDVIPAGSGLVPLLLCYKLVDTLENCDANTTKLLYNATYLVRRIAAKILHGYLENDILRSDNYVTQVETPFLFL